MTVGSGLCHYGSAVGSDLVADLVQQLGECAVHAAYCGVALYCVEALSLEGLKAFVAALSHHGVCCGKNLCERLGVACGKGCNQFSLVVPSRAEVF